MLADLATGDKMTGVRFFRDYVFATAGGKIQRLRHQAESQSENITLCPISNLRDRYSLRKTLFG